jgi:DNA-binding response OmpR family regulator
VTRQKILSDVWGETDRPVSRVLEVHLVALRAKINRPGLVRTVHGVGYQLGTAASPI